MKQNYGLTLQKPLEYNTSVNLVHFENFPSASCKLKHAGYSAEDGALTCGQNELLNVKKNGATYYYKNTCFLPTK
jgi:hypothetical protein